MNSRFVIYAAITTIKTIPNRTNQPSTPISIPNTLRVSIIITNVKIVATIPTAITIDS